MLPRCLGRMKHHHGTAARCDDHAIGEANPLTLVLTEELIADSPISGRVLFALNAWEAEPLGQGPGMIG